jgi:hypothetical protein
MQFSAAGVTSRIAASALQSSAVPCSRREVSDRQIEAEGSGEAAVHEMDATRVLSPLSDSDTVECGRPDQQPLGE